MASRRLLLALLLLGCRPAQQDPPRPPILIDADGGEPGGADPAPGEPPSAAPVAPPTDPAPAFSAPKADGALADTLPAPSPSSGLPGSCEGGTRRPGETWKVDCNECSCGDDGQSRCTAMACLPRPVH